MESEKVGNFVIDASVTVKWFCLEEDTEIALALREGHINGEVELAIPDLSLYEVGNALRYNKSLTESEVKEAVESIIQMGIDIIVPTKEVMDGAISLAFRYNITVYDAYYLSLAQSLGFSCITADGKLYEKVKPLGFVRLLRNVRLPQK